MSPDVRARAYAGVELLLDVIYIAQTRIGLDLESTLICYCVAEATMRPLVEAAKERPELLTMVLPPDEVRGSISRLLIADRTGLARETVRRKVRQLLDSGWLIEDGKRRLRTMPTLQSPAAQKAGREVLAAVVRYDRRLRELSGVGALG